jgi:membrane protease YdiL (CAAX protease family)
MSDTPNDTGPAPDPAPPAAADAPAPPTPEPAGPSRRAGWAELAAVLAVGVVPGLVGSVTGYHSPSAPLPYWLDTLQLTVLSGCTIFVTLYLIGRSGDGYAKFGSPGRPFRTPYLGVGLMLVAGWAWRLAAGLPDDGWVNPFPQPRGWADHVMMAVKLGAAGFAEELVYRAYLVTRLADLLRSRGEAVLVSSLLFAVSHVYQGLPGVGNSFLFGLAYGAVFLALGRVWPLAFGHALYNMRLELMAG